MISFVRLVTASAIFAVSTVNVPSWRTLYAPASSRHLLSMAMPRPGSALTRKRCERNADAREALYIALVVRQVVGRGLHAAVAVAAGKDDVDHLDRRQRAERRVAQRRIDRQVVLELLQVRAESLQLVRFRFVAQRDERLEGRLEVEP